MAVTGVLSVCCFLALLTRLVHLQVAERPAYAARAEANRWRVVAVEAARGRILDRAGRVLADSRPAWRIRLDRRVPAGERPALLERLAPVLGVPAADLKARVADPAADPVLPATLLDDAPDDVVVALRERQAEWAGVEIDSHPTRRYPYGSLAAHVLGTLGAAPGPGQAGRRGASGVEMAHNEALAGRAGETRIEVDSAGRPVRTVAARVAAPGGDVRLTIDLDVQSVAEQALADGMAAARDGRTGAFGLAAPAGSVVALDLRDGSVMALASAPTFQPAALAGRIPAATWAALHNPAAHAPLTNRALQGLYAPGSTFKPVTALAALGAGLITPATVIDDRGTYRLGSRTLQNAQGRAYGKVDLSRAMAVSSDVYFYGLGDRLYSGPPAMAADGPIQAVAARLGFGRPTGIDIGPEASGRVPGPGDRREAHARHPAAVPDAGWYPGDNVNLSIGQGDMLATPIQLAGAYATLATGLVPPTPHVVAELTPSSSGDPAGSVATAPDAEVRPNRPSAGLDPAARQAVVTGLHRAVGTREGTAAAAFAGFPLDRVPVAGKTGTAQVNGKADTSLFAAVAPADDPRFVVVAVVEEAGFGSTVAAPIVRRVLEVLTGVAPPPSPPPAAPRLSATLAENRETSSPSPPLQPPSPPPADRARGGRP
jgi:penicillin-binding protein 2